MRLNDVFSGNFLKAEDLQGRTVTVTINKVEVKEFDDGKKIIVGFQGKDRSLVCNKTNASIIAENLGSDDTDNWVGGQVQLTVKKVEYQGKLVPAIRVVLQEQAPAPVQQRPAQHGLLGKPKQAPVPETQPDLNDPDDPENSVPF